MVTIKLNGDWGVVVTKVSEAFLANVEAQRSDLKARIENAAERLKIVVGTLNPDFFGSQTVPHCKSYRM